MRLYSLCKKKSDLNHIFTFIHLIWKLWVKAAHVPIFKLNPSDGCKDSFLSWFYSLPWCSLNPLVLFLSLKWTKSLPFSSQMPVLFIPIRKGGASQCRAHFAFLQQISIVLFAMMGSNYSLCQKKCLPCCNDCKTVVIYDHSWVF